MTPDPAAEWMRAHHPDIPFASPKGSSRHEVLVPDPDVATAVATAARAVARREIERHGVALTRQAWDAAQQPKTCTNPACARVLSEAPGRSRSGRCEACARYLARHGTERPASLCTAPPKRAKRPAPAPAGQSATSDRPPVRSRRWEPGPVLPSPRQAFEEELGLPEQDDPSLVNVPDDPFAVRFALGEEDD